MVAVGVDFVVAGRRKRSVFRREPREKLLRHKIESKLRRDPTLLGPKMQAGFGRIEGARVGLDVLEAESTRDVESG